MAKKSQVLDAGTRERRMAGVRATAKAINSVYDLDELVDLEHTARIRKENATSLVEVPTLDAEWELAWAILRLAREGGE